MKEAWTLEVILAINLNDNTIAQTFDPFILFESFTELKLSD